MAPSRAHTILEAVRLTSNSEIPPLRQLLSQWPEDLKLDLFLRILLTYLPEGTDPESYVQLLQDVSIRPSSSGNELDPKFQPVIATKISENEAIQRVRRLRLTPLASSQFPLDQTIDPFTLFLVHQAHRIDSSTGSLSVVSQLLEPFVDHSDVLRTWMISALLPLLRLNYEYYPHSASSYSLNEFENLEERNAVQTLLSKAAEKNTSEEKVLVGRDLRGLVGPWMKGETSRKRRKLDHNRRKSQSASRLSVSEKEQERDDWSLVNDWILDLAIRDFPRAVDAISQWQGPEDVDYGEWGNMSLPTDPASRRGATARYAQAGLGTVYATHDASLEAIIGSHQILMQAAHLTDIEELPDLKRSDHPIKSGIPRDYLEDISPVHLLHNDILRSTNPLTTPNSHSSSHLNIILASCYKLLNLGNTLSSKRVTELSLFGTFSDQMAELRRTLYRLKGEKMDERVWASVRRQILWLRNWEDQSDEMTEEPRGIFSRIPILELETELLRAMLDGGCYSLAVDVYCKKGDPPLPVGTVENTILNAVLSSYDSASNGNKTRGGVRKASELISTFRNYFPKSEGFAQTSALLSATHAMSFYSLTLQHGVPFQPVNIRAHKDPMSLVGKILHQNPRSYTHLDDLLEIGQNLVAAGLAQTLPKQNQWSWEEDSEQKTTIACRRITRMAIEAALEEDDFDTAYSYIVNRLSAERSVSLPETSPGVYDDISWRAAYAAGRYPTDDSSGSALRRLEQRMELLSQALLLAPPAALSEVLAVWQQCEQQMTDRIARETTDEEKWQSKGDRKVPGEFETELNPEVQRPRDPIRGSIQEEAPMGLFEVARGAANALSKSAFPLRAPRGGMASKEPGSRPLSTGSMEGSSDGSMGGNEGSGRVRKRDMVSNMVTGSLASGIGWVIGESFAV